MPRLIKIAQFYQVFAVIALNTLILFLFLNLVALIFYESTIDKPEHQFQSFNSFYSTHKDTFHSIYPDFDQKQIMELQQTTELARHPALEFMQKASKSKYYNIGIENIRYNHFVNDQNAEELINHSVWVFGGSTLFGHGVADDQTIPYYLNEIDTTHVYINFGVQSYNQNEEIDKLLLLLKKGYRPEKVIFLDGVNDIQSLFSNQFHPAEIPPTNGNSYNQIIGSKRHLAGAIIKNIPVVELFRHWILAGKAARMDPNLTMDLYGVDNIYHSDPDLHHAFLSKRDPLLLNDFESRLTLYYKQNLDFLNEFASAFKFDFYVFLQPNGFIFDQNMFIRDLDSYKKGELHRVHRRAYTHLNNLVNNKALRNTYDISSLHHRHSNNYIDIIHYSPGFNKYIAMEILSLVHDREQ